MAYLSKITLLTAYLQLSEITNDPTSQGATQFTSALRYVFALDEFMKRQGHPCNTQLKNDKEAFIQYVGNVVSINDKAYTANFYNSIKTIPDFAVGSNFFSVNTVKTSLENRDKEYEFPKRGGKPLFVIKNGVVEERANLLPNLSNYLNSTKNKVAFAIWLCRNEEFSGQDLYKDIRENLRQRYSDLLIDSLLPSKVEFEQCFDVTYDSHPTQFDENDFPKPILMDTNRSKDGLLPPDELAEKVKESFIKFWKLIDQHGADYEAYVEDFENIINPYLIQLNSGYTNVFQVVDYELYTSLIKRIIKEFPEMAYITNGRQNNGIKYVVGSTHLHYSNYLRIIGNSDFRANMDKEQSEYQDVKIKELLIKPLQLIYYGAPGTGKSFTIDKVTNENNSVRTTFHPDSDYAGFVGAYKPTMEDVRLTVSDISPKGGAYAEYVPKSDSHPGTERKIVYKYVPQSFLKAYVEAWQRYGEGEPYYLVIEEINRGNCAQIFGDLFQLLDRNSMGSSSYAISADEDIRQFLAEDEKGFKSIEGTPQEEAIKRFVLKKDSGAEEAIGESILNGSKLLLPPNLRIWATMNTSDQSLFPIDSAFKRRWNWEYMPIQYNPVGKDNQRLDWQIEIDENRYSWGEFLSKINPIILDITSSEDKQMGYFFAKPDKDGKIISEKIFLNKVLFYLWTDVLKDYDLTMKPFIYETEDGKGNKVNKSYRFTDFFSEKGKEHLKGLIVALKLTPVNERVTPNEDNEETAE